VCIFSVCISCRHALPNNLVHACMGACCKSILHTHTHTHRQEDNGQVPTSGLSEADVSAGYSVVTMADAATTPPLQEGIYSTVQCEVM
jgi:hypothetical protein